MSSGPIPSPGSSAIFKSLMSSRTGLRAQSALNLSVVWSPTSFEAAAVSGAHERAPGAVTETDDAQDAGGAWPHCGDERRRGLAGREAGAVARSQGRALGA